MTTPHFRSPTALLMAMAAVMQMAFASWTILIYNFAIERLSFTGFDIGLQQSVREIPGFLAFAAVFLLFLFREQTLAYISLFLLAAAGAVTGLFESYWAFIILTFVSSLGFHYYETMNQSLALQWLPKATAPAIMGRIVAVGALSQLVAYALVYLAWQGLGFSYAALFGFTGVLSLLGLAAIWMWFPVFPEGVAQRKQLVLRKRYWLYYALTFMDGARRQIFVVFAAFMMVEKFGFKVHDVAALFFLNGAINFYLAPKIGNMIVRFGERKALGLEYVGLAVIFLAYAYVSNVYVAIALYVLDHAFFAMHIAARTYFQKISDPADIAPTAGVAFTINHIAAVFIPVVFGAIWLVQPALVFLIGSFMAALSLALSQLIPDDPHEGNEVRWPFSSAPARAT